MLSSAFDFCIQNESKNGLINGEIVNKQFNKGKAVKKVCSYLHIPLCDSIAFGDSMNDKEMLETAGLGICMQNGSEDLKKLADDICPSVREDGIYNAFCKYHLM